MTPVEMAAKAMYNYEFRDQQYRQSWEEIPAQVRESRMALADVGCTAYMSGFVVV